MTRPGKVPLKKLTVTIPFDLYRDVEAIVIGGKRWISEVDFIRHAVANEVDRWKREHPGTPASAEAVSAFGRRT